MSYELEQRTKGRFTCKIYPYFAQPEGWILWAAELLMGTATLVHIPRAGSRDDARALLDDQIKKLVTEVIELDEEFFP